MPRLLCITAHPDDEAGGFGGTLALYAERGVEISVICLTAGTAARNRGGAKTDAELAEMRTRELGDSCRLLGVKHWEVLGYQDAHLAEAELPKVVGELVKRIREIRPQVVLTFGPDGGMTAHLDHAMAGVFATIAFQWAGRSDRYPEMGSPYASQKLYYLTSGYKLPDRPAIAPPVITASIDIGPERFEKKDQAFRQHKTQQPLFERVRKNLDHPPLVELYHLACTREPHREKFETDLLDGVMEE
jgi:LmbE family N-acetylglucosaminyl deacetylase